MAKRAQRTPRDLAVIESLLEGGADLPDVAKRHFDAPGALGQLARWAGTSRPAQIIEQLHRLADRRAELNLARARTSAIERLLELASGGEGSELARKSCVDLLRVPRTSVRGESSDAEAPEELGEREQETLRALLEKLGSACEAAPNGSALGAPSSDAAPGGAVTE